MPLPLFFLNIEYSSTLEIHELHDLLWGSSFLSYFHSNCRNLNVLQNQMRDYIKCIKPHHSLQKKRGKRSTDYSFDVYGDPCFKFLFQIKYFFKTKNYLIKGRIEIRQSYHSSSVPEDSELDRFSMPLLCALPLATTPFLFVFCSSASSSLYSLS